MKGQILRRKNASLIEGGAGRNQAGQIGTDDWARSVSPYPFEAADRDCRAGELEAELAGIFEAHNRGGPASIEIPATFLKVEATRP